ncbi:ABC transporter ATP-binding protein [Thermodesulfobacteriota bacterium]
MIILDSVTKQFGSTTAVDNVSLRVETGDFFALLGPNGAGKTTIVRMLLGFSSPNSGMVTVGGIPANHPEARARVGYLAEQHKIPPQMSGREYLKRSAAVAGIPGPEAAREIDRVLTICGMQNDAGKKASGYSKGMRQRIGLASAIMNKPEILILDEPVSGLDPIGIREVRLVLEELHQDGVTIMLNSHFLPEVEKICQTAAIMHHGSIMVQGTMDHIVQDGETLEDVFVRHVGVGRG